MHLSVGSLLATTFAMTTLSHAGTPLARLENGEPAGKHWVLTLESAQLFGINNPRNYHLAPQIVSLGWVPSFSWSVAQCEIRSEIQLCAIAEPILHGPENHYFGGALRSRWILGSADSPWQFYLDGGVGAGAIDSTDDPLGQGQDFTFIILFGSGVRYAMNERLSIGVGILYQHLSNGGLSEPEKRNTALDSFGPQLGIRWTF
jgi:lipid A 3-O-deacylase